MDGCGFVGPKSSSLSIVYGCMAVLSFLLLVGCGYIVRRQNPWLLALFCCVLTVNIGYFALAVSKTLEQALWANRLAYWGSVFLPMAMLLIMLKVTGVHFRKRLPIGLIALGVLMFLTAASPGYLDIYYREVSMQLINGVCVLQKTYGPLHILYLVYLLGYFGVMVAIVIKTARRKELGSPVPAMVLAAAVFANIGVWLIEQMVAVQFEILSVSYIVSELFLLGLHMLLQENRSLQERLAQLPSVQERETQEIATPCSSAACMQYREGMDALTKTERMIFERYLAGKSTKEILEELVIKENTLKFHNKNIYGKLGVNSRKQLLEIYRAIEKNKS